MENERCYRRAKAPPGRVYEMMTDLDKIKVWEPSHAKRLAKGGK